jgi:uncharacterized protein GlcG (DUF336 family)
VKDPGVKLGRAQAIVADVLEHASGPVSVWVVDAHGELVAAASMDGAAPDARTTRELAAKIDGGELPQSFDPFFTFFLGGVAVFDGERRIGAVGVSGLPGDVDEELALGAVERSSAAS